MRPVGATQSMPVDVRVISATHRDLDAQRAAGEFREDLFYRLNVVSLDAAAARRAARGHSAARHALPAPVSRSATSKPRARARAGRDGAAGRRAVARQRAPAAERARAGGRARHDERDPGDRWCRARCARTPACSRRSRRRASSSSATTWCALLKITGGNVTQAATLAKRNRTEFYKLLQRHRLEPAMFKDGKL